LLNVDHLPLKSKSLGFDAQIINIKKDFETVRYWLAMIGLFATLF